MRIHLAHDFKLSFFIGFPTTEGSNEPGAPTSSIRNPPPPESTMFSEKEMCSTPLPRQAEPQNRKDQDARCPALPLRHQRLENMMYPDRIVCEWFTNCLLRQIHLQIVFIHSGVDDRCIEHVSHSSGRNATGFWANGPRGRGFSPRRMEPKSRTVVEGDINVL